MATEEATTEATAGTMRWKGFLPLQPNRRLWEIKTSVRNATPGGDGRGGEGEEEGEGDAEGVDQYYVKDRAQRKEVERSRGNK